MVKIIVVDMLVYVVQGNTPLHLVGHLHGLDLVQQEGHPHT